MAQSDRFDKSASVGIPRRRHTRWGRRTESNRRVTALGLGQQTFERFRFKSMALDHQVNETAHGILLDEYGQRVDVDCGRGDGHPATEQA
jgi:hypothetical protein